MLATTLLGLAAALAPVSAGPTLDTPEPRTCPSCGVYRGPNSHLIYDALLLQVDVWPEFSAAACQFEVAAREFVTLPPGACAAEVSYRARAGVSAAPTTEVAVVGATAQPRTCPDCGVYRGPNSHLIYDALLLQVDVWPEFSAAACQFEVAAREFVTLPRGDCAAEVSYRARAGFAAGTLASE